MFDNLSDRLAQTFKNIRGQGRLTEDNIKDAMRDVRMALLEADVALPVVKEFVGKVKERAVGQEVIKNLTPGQALIGVVRDELTQLMGEVNEELALNAAPPAVVLMAGLQGAGKTTTVAKLARFLKEKKKKKVAVVSCDVYRPAAIDQLKTLADDVDVQFYPSSSTDAPGKIAKRALKQAKKEYIDVLLVDTAGRLHIDEEMMAEIQALHKVVEPVETLFVVDAMTGQDAANTAKAFNEALPLTGVVLTKADGDARGGAALSVREITGKPIKFIGMGEKTEALEPFYPDRIASRILGMGDILSLVEEAEENLDREAAEKLTKKIKKGKTFDLEDFRQQIQQMYKMGGLNSLMDKMPGMANLPKEVKQQVDDRDMRRMEAIINSMTMKERRAPALIKGSRKRRIAAGSGMEVQDVNRLLKQFTQMQKMMKRMSKGGGLARMLKGLKGGGGGMPPGFPPMQ